jgi:hypothetical protein
LDAVVQVDAVFGNGGFAWMLQTDVALVLFDPFLDGTAGLPDVDLTTPALHAVYTMSLESQFMLHSQKELGIFFGGRPIDLILCLDSCLLMRLKVVLT